MGLLFGGWGGCFCWVGVVEMPLFWWLVMTYFGIIHQRAIFGFWGVRKWLWGNGLGAPSEVG